jgi:predicted nucleic acid-binding protein
VTTVVSDTSPITYLCLIGEIGVLLTLFTEVLIPPGVLKDLQHPSAPKAVTDWLAAVPDWVRVRAPTALQAELNLDPGETEAISLALELHVPAILIEEATGRRAAQAHGLRPLGTLAILVTADMRRPARPRGRSKPSPRYEFPCLC